MLASGLICHANTLKWILFCWKGQGAYILFQAAQRQTFLARNINFLRKEYWSKKLYRNGALSVWTDLQWNYVHSFIMLPNGRLPLFWLCMNLGKVERDNWITPIQRKKREIGCVVKHAEKKEGELNCFNPVLQLHRCKVGKVDILLHIIFSPLRWDSSIFQRIPNALCWPQTKFEEEGNNTLLVL